MTVLLNNLSARAPMMSDLDAVSALCSACNIAEAGIQDSTREELAEAWQRPDFNLSLDAWVIVARGEQIVGYAAVWHKDYAQIHSLVRVHPAYRSRGIGTLLLRLVEHRARGYVRQAAPGVRVTLSNTVSHADEAARQLLVREGYSQVGYFWRVVIEMNESFVESTRHGRLEFDLTMEMQDVPGTQPLVKRTDVYAARQYSTYVKELRPGSLLCEAEMLAVQAAPV